MSKVTIGILFAAIALLTLGTYLKMPFPTGVSGMMLVVALVYSFVVAKREMGRASKVIKAEEKARFNHTRKPARMPQAASPEAVIEPKKQTA